MIQSFLLPPYRAALNVKVLREKSLVAGACRFRIYDAVGESIAAIRHWLQCCATELKLIY